ncbi:mercury transporter [Streptomyces sp. HUAS TT20]|uniref:mercury transporter n=1 Tax=Streptomyces sp. HUAS TT20 TaxID=3447509 RepID=UPI0021DA0A9D|nr:mercury transporter [Streptomyces sp. HUAS 15-9]UXY25158.1 mercury transporter [Streptomyces sp. HUAS 15-9]
MSASRERSRFGGAVAVAAGLVLVVCCAGPLLLGGAGLGAVGGALANLWLITVGAVVLVAGTASALWCRARRRRGAGPDGCCPTVPDPHRREDDTPDYDVR